MSVSFVDYDTYNYTAGRPYGIKNIIIHHVGGISTASGIANTLNNRGVSAHWAIGSDGVIGRLIYESDRAWHAGDGIGVGSKGNDMGIGIEVSNDQVGGNWHVSDASFNLLVELVRDIAERNGLLPVKRGVNLFGHRDCSSTACPGDYLYSKLNELCERVNNYGKTAKPQISYAIIPTTQIKLVRDTALYDFEEGKAVKTYATGNVIDAVAIAKNEATGKQYYMTAYSYDNGKIKATNGFDISDCEIITPKTEEPAPTEPQDDAENVGETAPSGQENVNESEETMATTENAESGTKTIAKADYNEFIGKVGKSVDLGVEVAKSSGLELHISNKVYDVLKTLAVIVLPACSALYIGLANIWGFGFGAEVDATITLAISVINSILGLTVIKASADYKKGE